MYLAIVTLKSIRLPSKHSGWQLDTRECINQAKKEWNPKLDFIP